MRRTTPREITPAILRFSKQVVPDPHIEFLNVTPAPGAEVNECYSAVQRHVVSHGGRTRYGWQIWEWPRVMLEAEFHAVWEDKAGVLHDLTPKDNRVQRILFLPDPDRTYQGRQIDSIRLALCPQPAVAEFIKALADEVEFNNRGVRADQHGLIVVPADEAREYHEIQRRKTMAELEIMRPIPAVGRNVTCPCGSGTKYKNCHGRDPHA